MTMLENVELMRSNLIKTVNSECDKMREAILELGLTNEHEETAFETLYPLSGDSGVFRGKKPVSVYFSESERVNVTTWKQVAEVILTKVTNDNHYLGELYKLSGRISGKQRVLLDDNSEKMRRPLKIKEKLYMETHYDTESLLRILTARILSAIGYDYSHIHVSVLV